MSEDLRYARLYDLAEDAGVRVGGIIPRRLVALAGFSLEEIDGFDEEPLVLPLRRSPVDPLFEYRMRDGKRALIFRFCRDAAQVEIGRECFTLKGARHAELFELLAEHLRGPTTSHPDRVLSALARIATGDPDREEVAGIR